MIWFLGDSSWPAGRSDRNRDAAGNLEHEVADASVNPFEPPPLPAADASNSPTSRQWGALALKLVVVLACALGAAGLSVPYAAGPYAPPAANYVIAALNAIFGALLGIGLIAMGTVVVRRDWRWLMPGHWRAIETLTVLIGIVASLPWRGQPGFTVGISAFFMEQLSRDTARNLAGVVLYLSFACFSREKVVWRIYAWLWLAAYLASLVDIPIAVFNARADISILYLIAGALPRITALAALGGILIVIIGTIHDIRAKVPRDFEHYAGIVLPIVAYAISVLANLLL